ncbi:hypothetical protein DFJ58DRAFT_725202 [Suillus subalutaceus]|uniref:uncharacterized protein n=1 Tax=Suillus subalutaceus TaxID=48586 RepID=UPI001B85D011|nr:uncharacterized protein DFJ58DRAFT_725202 [Suillus subalutaceus]KAG1862716.1 hypothetical protein DFJ58DRAFT_725202 [Suillus subalutaceus]
MSTQNAPRRTRTSNATTWPGQIVLDAKIKRHTKAQKAADDLALKEAQEAQEAQVQKGLERLAADEANDLWEAVETVEAVKTMEATDNMEDGTTGANKRKVIKKGGKVLIKDAISNMQKKINEPSSKLEGDNANNVAHVSDGKDTPAP